MEITVKFDNLEEISEFQKIYVAGSDILPDFIADEVNKYFKEHQTETPKEKLNTEKPKVDTKAEVPDESEPKDVEAPDESEPKDVEALTLKARKLLAKVNKKTGKNTAKEWISDKGYDSLTDIESPDILDELITKAEDFLNAE